MTNDQKPYFDNVYTLESFVLNFVPSAKFTYDPYGQVIIYTDLMTDEDGNLIPFQK